MKPESGTETTRVIRLPPVSAERKEAYMRAAGREKKPLVAWMLEACDRAAIETINENPKT